MVGTSSSSEPEQVFPVVSRDDLIMLTKARLSFLVVVTTLVGFVLASKGGIDWGRLLHTVIGSTMAALGAAVFNQLMEIDEDARMKRTENRPLPAGRIPPAFAFGIGWLLAAIGLVHLAVKVNFAACYLTGLTLLVYLFIYTPLKRRSSWNTIVGAVSGGIPPLIGWVAAGGEYGVEAAFLFGLLFLWQLPHFLAINWMYRDEYVRAGFVMWSNDDASGRRTASLAIFFSVLLTGLVLLPWVAGAANAVFVAGGAALGMAMTALGVCFWRTRERREARRLFFFTLLYLPAILGLLVFTWNRGG